MIRIIDLDHGRYKFYTSKNGVLCCDKIGEPNPWRSFLGDNAICELFAYAVKLEDRIHTLEGMTVLPKTIG